MSEQVESKTAQISSTAARLNWLRAAVLGANDGIVSVAGVVVGVAAPNPANRGVIMAAGVAAVVAGAISMAAGEYVSVSTQRDTEKALVEKEKRLLAADPEGEFEQLVHTYMETGLSEETAREVVRQYTDKDPIRAHMSAEYRLDAEEFVNPWHAALSSAVAFTLGALLPLAAILLAPANISIYITFFAVLFALALLGYVSARLGNAPWVRAMIRVVIGGAIAMIVTGAIGRLVGVAL